MALNLNILLTRTITAIVFSTVLLSCIFYNYWSFSVLFFIVSIWGLVEFYQMAKKIGALPYKIPSIITGLALFSMAIFDNLGGDFDAYSNISLSIAIFSTITLFIVGLFDKTKNPILNLAFSFTGIVYVIIPFILLLYTSNLASIDKLHPDFNFHYVLGVILLIWANDALAYLVGSLIGKNKLFERISPGKTWEGSIGAFILTLATAFFIHQWFTELALVHWLILAVIVSVFGTIGDLVQSSLKRQAGVKDSGKIMPGHGGILDRFDSLIFCSPIVFAYLKLIL